MNQVQIFLPGTDQQVTSLIKAITLKKPYVMIVGSGSEKIAVELKYKYDAEVFVVVRESESLLNSRTLLAGEQNINIRLMDFTATDFKDSYFDLVYAQASISDYQRNKIIKEIIRILKPGGYFCLGEIISLHENQPRFIKDMFENSNISPLPSNEINEYYSSKGFRILFEKDLSYTLKDFYRDSSKLLKEAEESFDNQERSFYKKLVKKINHESNIYLRQGGDRYFGFKMLILKKGYR